MRRAILIAGAILALSGPAEAGGGLVQGCFERVYTPAHLQAHPEQIVQSILLSVRPSPPGFEPPGQTWADLSVRFADQGRLKGSKHAGQTLTQSLNCWSDDGKRGCSVDCDGGWFTVQRQGDGVMVIRTEYLMVGDTEECGGAVDLAEIPGKPVDYRLEQVADAKCEAISDWRQEPTR